MNNKEILNRKFEINTSTLLNESIENLNFIRSNSPNDIIKHYGLNDNDSSISDVRNFFLGRCVSGIKSKRFHNYHCETRLDELRTENNIAFNLTELNVYDQTELVKHYGKQVVKETQYIVEKARQNLNKMFIEFDKKNSPQKLK